MILGKGNADDTELKSAMANISMLFMMDIQLELLLLIKSLCAAYSNTMSHKSVTCRRRLARVFAARVVFPVALVPHFVSKIV